MHQGKGWYGEQGTLTHVRLREPHMGSEWLGIQIHRKRDKRNDSVHLTILALLTPQYCQRSNSSLGKVSEELRLSVTRKERVPLFHLGNELLSKISLLTNYLPFHPCILPSLPPSIHLSLHPPTQSFSQLARQPVRQPDSHTPIVI